MALSLPVLMLAPRVLMLFPVPKPAKDEEAKAAPPRKASVSLSDEDRARAHEVRKNAFKGGECTPRSPVAHRF